MDPGFALFSALAASVAGPTLRALRTLTETCKRGTNTTAALGTLSEGWQGWVEEARLLDDSVAFASLLPVAWDGQATEAAGEAKLGRSGVKAKKAKGQTAHADSEAGRRAQENVREEAVAVAACGLSALASLLEAARGAGAGEGGGVYDPSQPSGEAQLGYLHRLASVVRLASEVLGRGAGGGGLAARAAARAGVALAALEHRAFEALLPGTLQLVLRARDEEPPMMPHVRGAAGAGPEGGGDGAGHHTSDGMLASLAHTFAEVRQLPTLLEALARAAFDSEPAARSLAEVLLGDQGHAATALRERVRGLPQGQRAGAVAAVTCVAGEPAERVFAGVMPCDTPGCQWWGVAATAALAALVAREVVPDMAIAPALAKAGGEGLEGPLGSAMAAVACGVLAGASAGDREDTTAGARGSGREGKRGKRRKVASGEGLGGDAVEGLRGGVDGDGERGSQGGGGRRWAEAGVLAVYLAAVRLHDACARMQPEVAVLPGWPGSDSRDEERDSGTGLFAPVEGRVPQARAAVSRHFEVFKSSSSKTYLLACLAPCPFPR